jgi:hypothetical protein
MATDQSSTAETSAGTRKRSAQKPGAKKAGAKKTSAKKTSAKRTSASKTGADETSADKTSAQGTSTKSAGGRRRSSAMEVARSAARQLAELTGRVPECVIGIERAEEGWTVELEVVESRRIPDSTDVLATYRVQVDDDGELMGYHRVERYVRGKSGRGDGAR